MNRGERRFAIVLAAGHSKRFRSETPKVLHPLCGKIMLEHVLEQLLVLDLDTIFLVVGSDSAPVRKAFSEWPVTFVVQEKQLGTGHAVSVVLPHLKGQQGSVIVLYADTPLITASRLEQLQRAGHESETALSLITSRHDDPTGYGRIIRGEDGAPIEIIEEKDATPKQRAIQETNPGFYCFDLVHLEPTLRALTNDNAQGEYYLTDAVSILTSQGLGVVSVDAPCEEVFGVNNRVHLAFAESVLRRRIKRRWMLEGVTLVEPESVRIDADVTLDRDVLLHPGVALLGKCHVSRGCVVGPNTIIENATLQPGVTIDANCVIRETQIGEGSRIGPFAHLRGDSTIGREVRIGNFVEIKASRVGAGTQIAHLSYVGDARVGKNVIIGAGTITCNFDGVKKNTTRIEDDVFIGSNCQLIAPVTIQRKSIVAAGSTVTSDVPPESLAIARSRQVIKKRG